MATRFHETTPPAATVIDGALGDRDRAIIGPWRDALLLWGAPVVAFLFVRLWLYGWGVSGAPAGNETGAIVLFGAIAVLTFAHLIAVVPRAYLNAEVFAAYRWRLTAVPALLLALLLLSPTALIVAGLLAILWDVHHSAMQNFGFARLYDMKAGNPPALLRATDLRLNWALYVGPLAAGASFGAHFMDFGKLDGTLFTALVTAPGFLAAHHGGIRAGALACYGIVAAWTIYDYARAIRGGYRVPAHKLATLVVTGAVSILAWGFSAPLVAFGAINLYHAVQYFALVWVKEGRRMARFGTTVAGTAAFFAILCALFGIAYAVVGRTMPQVWLAPFVACSLLHFWYDGFVWSVRKRQV